MNPDKDSEALIVAIRLEHEATGKDYIALKFIRSNGRGEEQLVLPASIALQDKRGTRKQLIDHGAVIADDLEIDALIDPSSPWVAFSIAQAGRPTAKLSNFRMIASGTPIFRPSLTRNLFAAAI